MITYDEAIAVAEKTVNLTYSSKLPERKFMYYAYRNGTCSIFDNEKEAKRFSCLIEKKMINSDEVEQYWDTKRIIEIEAFTIWYESLREEWSELSNELFKVCYGEAELRGHSSGCDEVANCMYDVVEFAQRVLKLKG